MMLFYRVAIITLIVIACNFAPSQSPSGIKYISKEGHFQFTIPIGWRQISPDKLQSQKYTVEKLTKEKVVGLEAAFIPDASNGDDISGYPYVLLYVTPGRSSEKAFSSSSTNIIDNRMNSILDNIGAHMTDTPNKYYDYTQHICYIWFRASMAQSKFIAFTAAHLGSASTVQFGFYSNATAWDDDSIDYAKFLDTFKFDSGYSYDDISPTLIENVIKYGLLGFALSIFGLWQKGKRTSLPPTSNQLDSIFTDNKDICLSDAITTKAENNLSHNEQSNRVPISTNCNEWEILKDRAFALHFQGYHERAIVVAEKALSVAEHVGEPDHPNVVKSLYCLAFMHFIQHNYTKSEPLIKRALAIQEKILAPTHPDMAESLNILAGVYDAQGQYTLAEPLYKRSLTIQEMVLGLSHPDVCTNLENLAKLYRNTGRNAEAEEVEKRIIVIRAAN